MELHPQRNSSIAVSKGNILQRFFKLFSLSQKHEIIEFAENAEEKELLDSIIKAKNDWINSYLNFEYVNEQEIVDYYTYRIKACEIRYAYLIKKAKEIGIKVDRIETPSLSSIQDPCNN